MGRIKALRTRHALNRFFHIITIALGADLLVGYIATALYYLFGWVIGLPRFFEMLFIILAIREYSQLKMERFGVYLDKRFSLKDRVYSHLWYADSGNTPEDIIDAQSRDCLSSIDFQRLKQEMRLHIPRLLPLVLVLFAVTLYTAWNAEYRPPGIMSRVVLNSLSPQIEESNNKGREALDGEGRPSDPSEEITRNENTGGPFPQVDTGKSDETAGDTIQPGSENSSPGPDGGVVSPAGPGAGGQEASGNAGQAELVAPDTVDSIPITDQVSLPVPPRLEPVPEDQFASLPDANEFLNLIPGQGGPGVASVDQSVIENFRSLIEKYPPVYREQLETYYRELLKWEQMR